jgi:hypothetical protein
VVLYLTGGIAALIREVTIAAGAVVGYDERPAGIRQLRAVGHTQPRITGIQGKGAAAQVQTGMRRNQFNREAPDAPGTACRPGSSPSQS